MSDSNYISPLNNTTTIESREEKIDKLNEQAWQTRVNDSPRSFELSKESVSLARSINYKKGLAHGLKSLAFCFVRVAKNEEAFPLLSEALPLLESLNDLEGQAVVNGYMAIVQRNRGNIGASLELSFKALELSQKTGFRENEGTDLYQIGVTYRHLGNFEKALDYLYKSLSIYREDKNQLFQSYPINVIGSIYFENGDYTKALEYFEQGLAGRRASLDKLGEAGSLDNIGLTHFKLGNYAQAINYCQQSFTIAESTGDKRAQSNALLHLAEIYKQKGEIKKATRFSNESLEIKKLIGDKRREVETLLFLADLHKIVSGDNKVLELLNDALKIAEELKMLDLLSQTRLHLSEYYKHHGDYKEALKHLDLHINLEKEFHKNAIAQKVSNLEITHKAEETRKEADAIRQKNDELTKLNEEIESQKKKLIETLTELKATQAQLIQSEKMASLGELTSGIAHEIQNPLNFVNNFSEVSNELIGEMKEELAMGNTQEANEIADDLRQNLEKINHHGKRADAIVKGMLQHSRVNTGQKELTDINALCDEYLRLAYHGFKAKDKSFSATIETDFDSRIEKIKVVPQDMGRVIINLINNAFYAVNEKAKLQSDLDGYKPQVFVQTKRGKPNGDHVEIRVADNGDGVPQKILGKIFQPFFTTKPTGQGTGLGLSLAYDIVKGHGGEIKVETKEREGAEFTITLPIKPIPETQSSSR
jgi:signal transduction histidine kinase